MQKNRRRLPALLFVLCFCISLLGIWKQAKAWAAEQTEETKNDSGIHGVDDLPGKNIGVQIGTTGDTYATDYENDDAGSKVTRFNKGADAVQALKQGKIDCVIIDEEPAKAFLEKNPELGILDEEFVIDDYAICIAKENTDLRDRINEALDILSQNGTLKNIMSNYIGDDTKGTLPYVSPEGLTRENGTLTMATNVAFPPYEFYENGEAVGIDVDVARAIADILNMELVVSDMEFESIIVAVQSGKADVGIAGMSVTEDRLKNIDFTNSYAISKQVIMVKTGENVVKVSLTEKIKQVFLEGDRWKYIPRGLLNTVIITLLAGLLGIIIGFLFAIVRVYYERNDVRHIWIRILNVLVRLYITVFRGTPVMVQLLIMYYVIFASVKVNPIVAAVLAFGLNSAAYVAEAVRAGIMSIDIGQFEAGRSLGLTYGQTMTSIIMPQAIKNALPTMCNEFIALLKESSIVGYIGLMDLTKAGDVIRSSTYEAMLPLLTVALVYLLIVVVLTGFVGKLERRLKKDAR